MSISGCKSELRSIIQALRALEVDVRGNFTGIGEVICGDCISKAADGCDGIAKKLAAWTDEDIRALIDDARERRGSGQAQIAPIKGTGSSGGGGSW